ncbi:DUF4349 domain-containing protein [Aeromicrobium sp. Marseille-Q0843]|uniref:DUF4349 domain-containing protein n=1 Tax=Aeromicrobium phoceense TaxID=2754045 RepID=A0A838XGL2_9ACTN|nr:DUF4349 domain-containing protein [Aeromicrobium phoceense]MBA4608101.1 DUF4349 domain-containing protein [Aeromicrobium phoceense]
MTGTELPVLEPERIERMRAGVMDAVTEHAAQARRRRRRVRGALAGAAAAAVVVVGGVGIGLSGGLVGTTGGSDSGTSEVSDLEAPAAREDAGAAEAEADDAEAPFVTTVVTRGSMSVEVDAVDDAVASIRDFVGGTGGRIDSESLERSSASLVVRVPAGDVEPLRRELDELGDISGVFLERSDQATVIADVDARIESLETSIRRLRAIIADSSSTRDLLDAEAQLTQRQGELESLQAQRRALRDETSLATIDVSVVARDSARSVDPGDGFVGGPPRGWNALVDTVDALVTAVGVAVPWLLPVGLVAAVALAFRRWRARRDEG